jgi:AraC family transcriptional regulator of adaptative response / DNA-3-methyladenine glycosylase II
LSVARIVVLVMLVLGRVIVVFIIMRPRMRRRRSRFAPDPDGSATMSESVRPPPREDRIPVVMDTYSAVVTTGIYCRPGCSATPNPKNVLRYEIAAAAEASGFRACLRCRPYRRQQPLRWDGPELVCRAVQLVLDGALEDQTEDGLASRLGMSARNLRRLFNQHLGVTPAQLARSSRAHFARRLLDDTDLSVTDIAFAAGFGSVRQFNRAAREIFRAAPRELRARRRKADRLVADGGLALRLPYNGPLDWDHTLAYLAARAIPGVESVAGRAYRRTVVIDGDPGVIELLEGDPDASGAHLLLRAHLPHWEGLIHLVERARRIAALDAPTLEANAALEADPLLGPLVAARPGIRQPGAWDPFEVGVRIILGQQVSVAGASTTAGRLVQALGTPVAGLGPFGLTHTFPTAETLAAADLSNLGLTRARAAAVQTFARAVAEGQLHLDNSQPLDDFVAARTALPGLGPWTAHVLALRLGERDAFPASDLGLRRAYERVAPAATEPLEVVAERWRPWRSFAAIQLWAADGPDQNGAHEARR